MVRPVVGDQAPCLALTGGGKSFEINLMDLIGIFKSKYCATDRSNQAPHHCRALT
ncbi:MAG: hypothetical protein HKO79_01560, partial [Desulfobacterales bacterium]|nr:hypothetical protein [Desulfobacterales bacterium]